MGNRPKFERLARAGVWAGAVSVVAIAAAAIAQIDPAAVLSDVFETEEVSEVAAVRRQPAPKRQATPSVKLINAGIVSDDPVRHAAAVAAMERAASEPADAITDDDDLSPTGSYADWYPAKVKTYRTICVRLCDGALTPISFSTTHDRLALDALRCRKGCGSPSKLYIQRNPASDTESFVDLDGKPYSELPTAFKFRTSYDEACTCRPHAWQSIAMARHRVLEIKSRSRAGREVALGRLTALKNAAFRSTVAARAGGGSMPGIVTGSTTSPVVSGDRSRMAAITSEEGASDAALLVPGAAKPAAKGARKAGGKRSSRSAALAKSKGARAKPANSEAFVVVFGPDLSSEGVKPNKLTPVVRPMNSLVRSASSTRRYDGNDWRISNYEPM